MARSNPNARATPAPAAALVEAAMKHTPTFGIGYPTPFRGYGVSGLAKLLPAVSGPSSSERSSQGQIRQAHRTRDCQFLWRAIPCAGASVGVFTVVSAVCFAVSESDVAPRLSLVVVRVVRSGAHRPSISLICLAASVYHSGNKFAGVTWPDVLVSGAVVRTVVSARPNSGSSWPGLDCLANCQANKRAERRGVERLPALFTIPCTISLDMPLCMALGWPT